MPPNTLPVLGHAGASEYLARRHGICRAAATLAKYACLGVPGGVERPRFRKAGRDVLYDPADLDAFAARLIREPATGSTSNGTPQRGPAATALGRRALLPALLPDSSCG
jgi:hypothetical protein